MSNNEASGNESAGAVCPTCEDSFNSEHGMKIHHAKIHGESVAGHPLECQNCNDTFRHWNQDRKYCSPDCSTEGRRVREVRECPVCGEEFRTSEKPSRSRKTCSNSCRRKLSGQTQREKRVTLTCPQCGDDFDVKPSHRDRRTCCSTECRNEYKTTIEELQGENSNLWKGGKVSLICEQCDEEYKVYQCRSDISRFCSRECESEWRSEHLIGEKAPHYKGGTYPYGSGWTPKKKREVRKEYGYKCAGCPMTQEEHIEKYGRRLEVHHISKARNVDDEETRNSKDNLVPLCHKCHLSKWELMAPLRPQIIE